MSEAADQGQANFSCPECMATYRGGFETCPVDGTPLEQATADPLVGVTIADQYVVDKCVGEGAMGRVYLAHHARLTKRKFAMKVLLGDLAADPTMRLRFAQEAEAASRLQHPNVVPVLDFGKTEGGLHYLVMDFIEGGTLSDRIEKGALSEKETIGIAIQICQGLTHAHEQGLVHRDFKPDNVALVERDGKSIPQILDFGLAIISTPEETSVRLTSAGLVVGTPAYVSPEQCQGKPVDEGTDLFAFGVSLYEMASGVLPFDGSVIDLLYKNATVQPPGIQERSGIQVSSELEAIIMRLMAKSRSERFADAREVLAALEAIDSPAASVVRVVGAGVAQPGDKVKLESAQTMVASTQIDGKAVAAGAAAPTLGPHSDSKGPSSAGAAGGSKGPTIAIAVAVLGAAAVAAFLMLGGKDKSETGSPAPEKTSMLTTDFDASTVVSEAPTEKAPIADLVLDAGTQVVAEVPPDAAPVTKSPPKKNPRIARTKPRQPRIKNSKEPEKPEVPDTAPPPPPTEKPKPPPPEKVPDVKPPPVKPKPPVKPPVVKPKVPTSFKTSIELASFSSKGSLSKSVTTTAVKRGKKALQKCYESSARASKKNVALTVRVKFRINEQGRADKVKVSGAGALKGLKGCIESVIKKKVKPKSPPDTGTQSVEFVVKYKPKQ